MSKSGKTFLTIGLVVLIALVCVCATGCQDKTDLGYVPLEDMTFPEHVDRTELFGLFFLDHEGNLGSTTGDISAINFDPAKPTIIFAHGMQFWTGYNRCEDIKDANGNDAIDYKAWLENGYNFGIWRWAQFSDCDTPNNGTAKVWSRKSGSFTYEDENGKRTWETEDVLKYSIAECFVAYWMDFMHKVDNYTGSEIIFAGHSLGASTMFAVSDYLFKLNEDGYVGTEYLPDRLVFLDAYVDTFNYVGEKSDGISMDVPWLDPDDAAFKEYGVVGRTREVAIKARKLGIATIYVKSSMFSTLSDMAVFGGKPGTANIMLDSYLRIDLDTPGISDMSQQHNSSIYWYIATMRTGVMYDGTDPNGEVLGIDAKTSNAYLYARVTDGADGCEEPVYTHNGHGTGYYYADDTMKSSGITSAKIAGFAFRDVNDNGINDDRLYNRVEGVTVELYRDGQCVETKTTTKGGYYEFVLGEEAIGKNYYIKVNGVTLGKVSDGGEMNNGIGEDGISASWSPTSNLDLKIINIGVK